MVTFEIEEATRRAIEALTPSGFEQLIYEVLRVTHPRVIRMRAPDGGADLIDPGPPLQVWQAKHYRELKWSDFRKSLERAVAVHKPEIVTFVVPSDLTAKEYEGWEKLVKDAPSDVSLGILSFAWFHAELERPELTATRNRLLQAPAQSLLPPRVTVSHAAPVPAHWVARADVIEQIDEWRRDDAQTVLAVVGIGGTGKSTLVQHWFDRATEAPDSGFEGALQFSFYEHGDRTFADFLREAQAAFAIPLGAKDPVDALLDVLRERRILLFLDGVERLLREYAVAAPELVEEREPHELEPAARAMIDLDAWRFFFGAAARPHAGKVILTTRLMPLDLDTAACGRLDLAGLTAPQSIALLRKFGIVGRDEELARAADDLGGHPLTLARLANVLRYDPVMPKDIRIAPRYAGRIDLRRRRYDIFVAAFRATPPPLRQLLLLLAASRSPMPGADLVALAQAARVTADAAALQELADEMWITMDDEAIVRLHPLARRWLSAQDPDVAATHAMHAALWQPRASAIDVNAIAKHEHATVADLHPVTELIYHLTRAGRHEEAWNIFDNDVSATLGGKLSAHRLRSELLLEFFASSDERQPPRLAHVQAQGSLLNSLANDLSVLGQPKRAIPLMEQAVAIAHDPKSLAVRVGNLALTRIRVGELRRADEDLNEQHRLGEESGDRVNVLVALQERARLHAICGRYAEAHALLAAASSEIEALRHVSEEVLDGFSPIGWAAGRKREFVVQTRHAVGTAYTCLALVLAKDDAVAAADAAFAAATATGAGRAIARAESFRGMAYLAAGDAQNARKKLTELLASVGARGLGDLEPEVMTTIARTWQDENRRTAMEFAELAEREARWHGNRLQIADAVLVRATLATGAERARLAIEARQSAWCDGPPFFYELVVSSAASLL